MPGIGVWLREGSYASLVVDRGSVDPGTHGKGEHFFRRERNEKGHQGVRFLERWVEPPGVLPRRKDHRHPVVDRGQDGVSGSRQNCARFDDTLVRALPSVPQSCESEKPFVTHMDKEWPLPALLPLPLVETICWD